MKKTIPTYPILAMLAAQLVIDVVLLLSGIIVPGTVFIFGSLMAAVYAATNQEQ